MYSVGSASDYGAQMLSHDFIKRFTREMIFDLVYGTTFSNRVMLMSLHRCARTMCLGTLRLRCLMGATVKWWSRGLGRGRREEKRRSERVGGSLLYVHVPGTFPKWMAVCSCLLFTSRGYWL
ncbi:hypothetical protein N7537_008090 [Penicillium hordei]|uniref:Uncharacterized protein n=1 Tax=Penicillium hordei TaxID=40994 RepID=A0AAD6E0Z5_9EURO|nr:uncharacterized protein N7537_008090 [Penicillium hordei]KAJ5598006.1 hypothetical protein N7537_008090 [Penicillium hordei]